MRILRSPAMILLGLFGLLGSSFFAFAAPNDPDESNYYIVTRQDMRQCLYPSCGGYFVKAVNRAMTLCANGQWRAQCQVIQFDMAALNLTEEEKAEYNNAFSQGGGLVRGKLVEQAGADEPIPVLVADELWLGQAQSESVGTFYNVIGTGIVCITSPCPSFEETRLNTSGVSQRISMVNLAASGASQEKLDEAYRALESGILVAGVHRTEIGPGGVGLELIASEFYLPFPSEEGKPCVGENCDVGEPCGDNICGEGEYCCNASCGICAPLNGACIQMVCEQSESGPLPFKNGR
ncbi:MAG: hypothetical protein JXR29_00895 [Methylothermaceae bacterium]|nr:hypothetical protein [Methylothermaceae bacterium]